MLPKPFQVPYQRNSSEKTDRGYAYYFRPLVPQTATVSQFPSVECDQLDKLLNNDTIGTALIHSYRLPGMLSSSYVHSESAEWEEQMELSLDLSH